MKDKMKTKDKYLHGMAWYGVFSPQRGLGNMGWVWYGVFGLDISFPFFLF
jgi:hypothetical protein